MILLIRLGHFMLTNGKHHLEPMNAIIRKAEVRDIPEIQRLYRQLDTHHVALLPKVFQPIAGDARRDDTVRERIDRDHADFLLAELEGHVVGFVNVHRAAHPDSPMFRPHEFAMIEDAVVDEPYRGKGLGTVLFRAAMDWAEAQGLQHVQTTVWNENAGAKEFYLSRGFRPMTMRLEMKTERNWQHRT